MELLEYDFIQRALLAGLITAIICPLMGIFIVVRRQSLIGDGLGHIAFAGVTGGYLLGILPVVGAALLTLCGSIGIELVRRNHNQFSDMVLAIFFYAGMALAIIFSTMSKMPSAGLLNVLFGSIMTVSTQDLLVIGLCGIVVIFIMAKLFKKLMLMALDEDISHVAGLNTGRINMIFSALIALVVVVGMTVVGILLISALMVIPVAAAINFGKGFKGTLLYAVVFSVIAVIGGLIISFYLDIAPGGTIVMTAILLYGISAIMPLIKPTSKPNLLPTK